MPINYHMPLYRPPSEGNNLIIQVTIGCSFNQCSFCSMYRDKVFSARPLDAVFQDIRQAASTWPDARRVFLADGDALCLPTDQPVFILEALKKAFPHLSRVSCYATPSNILNKSPDALRLLKEKGLQLLYLGIESGSNLISGLNPPRPVIFRSNHASNALALAGNLPRDKEKLCTQLQDALDGQTSLRPWFTRGM